MKYTLINKFTGKLYRNACSVYENNTLPINEDVLQYVALTDQIVNLVNNDVPNTVLDPINTVYNLDTNTWTVITMQVPANDIVADRTAELARLKIEAQRFYNLVDIPPALKTKVGEYITELNAFIIPTDSSVQPIGTMNSISWPTKPWV